MKETPEIKNIPTEISILTTDLEFLGLNLGCSAINGLISIQNHHHYHTPYILKSLYDSLLKEKEELEKKLSEVKKRTEIIKQDAEYKLQENSDRALSESAIEADACIDVCNEILMTIIKPTEK